MRRSLVLRLGTVVAVAAAAVLTWAAPAAAHVTVNPNSATQGGYAKLAFRVPNEKDKASTVKLEVFIPTDKPISSVSLKPTAGWTAVAERTKLATPLVVHERQITEVVSKITWTAAAGADIKPGQFQEFEVSMGPLPETDKLVFKALQTYSDDDVVRWIDEPVAGAEAEHPAPVLKLTKATTTGGAAINPVSEETATEETKDNSGTALTLGVVGVLLGLAGLVVGLLAYRRSATPTAAA